MKKCLVLAVLVLGILVTPALAQEQPTVSQLQAIIAQLMAQLAALRGGGGGGAADTFCHNFNLNLRVGDQNNDVTNLYSALIREGFLSKDNSFQDGRTVLNFDESVAAAVVGFQEKYASDILAPSGLTRGTGYVGPSTRTKLNQLYRCNGSAGPSPVYPWTPGPVVPPIVNTTNNDCSGLVMGWSTGRRDAYSYQTDACDGYRQLDGNIIGPSCYSREQCLGTNCVSIQDAKLKCGMSSIPTPLSNKPSITVVTPNGGESYSTASAVNFYGTVNFAPKRLVAYLYDPVRGNIATTYPSNPGSAGEFKGVFGVSGKDNAYGSGQYKITVCDELTDSPVSPGKPLCDTSDNYFTLLGVGSGVAVQPHITVTSPNGGQSYLTGDTMTIIWTAWNWPGYPLEIYLVNGDNTKIAKSIATNISPDYKGGYNWVVSNDIPPGQYKIHVGANKKGGPVAGEEDSSDNYFTITAPVTP